MFLFQSPLQEVKLTSTFCNCCGNKKNCETRVRSFQSMFHKATICATCVVTKLRGKLIESLIESQML